MSQQINLFDPSLLTRTRYFSARAMTRALAVFVVIGASLCGYSVYRLNLASTALRSALLTQSQELNQLHQAAQQANANVGSSMSALTQALASRRAELGQKTVLLQALQRGLLQPGFGHAARLQLVAATIPASAWVTAIKADETALDISGLTLEPEQLNQWVTDLAASPLLSGQQLATMTVEKSSNTGISSSLQLWSFRLVSAVTTHPTALGSVP